MPLLRKKQFEKSTTPDLLRDNEEVFYCEVTKEIFRDYDEFCQRIILVNSMVWSCAMTGKTNLTYAEALESEKAAKKTLKDFPIELRIPVLYLASKTRRTGFGDMAEDVFAFVKDRFFVGEIVESCFTENNWKESHVLQVIAPNNEQIEAYTAANSSSPDKSCFSPPASLFRYEVEQLDANDQDSSQVMIVEANQVRRKKGPFNKEKLRLFLKQFVECNQHGAIVIKESVKRKYNINTTRFDRIFDGPLPDFESAKRVIKPVSTNGKKVKQETLSKYLEKPNHPPATNGKSLLEEMKKKEKEYQQKIQEMKQKKIEEKELEKQKKKEENLKISSYVKEWYKPRDDLELEDQKCLPAPTPVETKIPAQYFGDSLMVLEFVKSFSSLLRTKDFFPGGFTMELLERALIETEVAGPLTDIVQMLLTALFNVQEEEVAYNKKSETEVNTDDSTSSMTLSEASRKATLALNWSKVYQGTSLSNLPLYPLTVSEVLRLHLLSSGARLNEQATKWRYQQRGGYMSEDDPGLSLRIKQPHILKELAVNNLNQLSMGDRLTILTCLVDQLLTYADVRDTIEEKLEKSKQLKLKLRSLQTSEKKFEQEMISSRLKIKRENKNNAEQMKKELDKLAQEIDKKRGSFEKKIKEVINQLSEYNVVLGSDRAYQRYYKIGSVPGFFVENDEQFPGICLDKIVVQKPELVDAQKSETLNYVRKLYGEYNSDKENDNGVKKTKKINGAKYSIKLDFDINTINDLKMCTANFPPCPVHSRENKPSWSFYHEKEDVQKLISSLNKRGIRESELKQVLEMEQDYIETVISNTNATKLNPTLEKVEEEKIVKKVQKNRYEDTNLGYPAETDISDILELSLIDSILEMEEKLFVGDLGHLKVKGREKWRKNLLNRHFNELDKTLIKKEDPLDKIKKEEKENNSRPGTPDSYKDPSKCFELNGHDTDLESSASEQQLAVKTLAIALVQVAQAVEPKNLKRPLGQAQITKREKENRRIISNILDKWERSLLCATSYSQIFLHYCTLDNCIMWGRSIPKASCCICRSRKSSNPETLIFCDGCNKGHHIFCVKPKLATKPQGEWFCNKCKPEELPRERETRRTRKIFDVNSSESEDEVEVMEDDENEEMEEEIDIEEVKTEEKNLSLFEVCEVCGSGGRVICCDFCPKVYHLECTQPALRRVPRGEWKCHKCRRQDDKSCSSESTSSVEEAPQRRSTRRTQDKIGGEDDDLPLHNAVLQELLADVMKHKDSWPFVRPVTKHEVPDYYDIIKNPMDFGTIKYKLNMGEYKNDAEVMADSALVFENCDTYNNSEAIVYKCGVRLLKYFEKRSKELGIKFPDGVMGEIESEIEENDDAPTKAKRARLA